MGCTSLRVRVKGKYDLDFKNPLSEPDSLLTADEMTAMYKDFIDKYPVISIEDPFEQDAWDAFSHVTLTMPNIQWVGDDLLVTNIARVKTGIQKAAVNTLLLKVCKAQVSHLRLPTSVLYVINDNKRV